MKYTLLMILFLVSTVAFIYLLMTNWFLALLLLLAIGIAFFLSKSIRIVKEYERAIIFRFGRFHRVAGPGIIFIIPGIDKIVQIIDVRTKAMPFVIKDAFTSDGAKVDVRGILYYKIVNPSKAVLNVENFQEQIYKLVVSDIRDLIAGMTLRELFTNVEILNEEVKKRLSPILHNWGIMIKLLEIRSVTPAPEIAEMLVRKRAMEEEYYIRKMLADARRIAIKALGEGARYLDDKSLLYLYMLALQELSKKVTDVDIIGSGLFGGTPPKDLNKILQSMGLSVSTAIALIKNVMENEKHKAKKVEPKGK